jgi:hypothetical protein
MNIRLALVFPVMHLPLYYLLVAFLAVEPPPSASTYSPALEVLGLLLGIAVVGHPVPFLTVEADTAVP